MGVTCHAVSVTSEIALLGWPDRVLLVSHLRSAFTVVSMVPILPLELECEIFEIVASLGTKRIPPLLRVARRVKLWWIQFLCFVFSGI